MKGLIFEMSRNIWPIKSCRLRNTAADSLKHTFGR